MKAGENGAVRGFLYHEFLFILWLFFFYLLVNCNALIVITQPSLFKHYDNVDLWLRDLGCIWVCGENVMNIFVFIIKLYTLFFRVFWPLGLFCYLLTTVAHDIFIWLLLCIQCWGEGCGED